MTVLTSLKKNTTIINFTLTILMTEQETCKINMNRFLIQTTVILQEHSMVIHMSTPIQAGKTN